MSFRLIARRSFETSLISAVCSKTRSLSLAFFNAMRRDRRSTRTSVVLASSSLSSLISCVLMPATSPSTIRYTASHASQRPKWEKASTRASYLLRAREQSACEIRDSEVKTTEGYTLGNKHYVLVSWVHNLQRFDVILTQCSTHGRSGWGCDAGLVNDNFVGEGVHENLPPYACNLGHNTVRV